MSSSPDVRYRRLPADDMILVGDNGELFHLVPIARVPGDGPPRVILARRVGKIDRLMRVNVRHLVLEAFVSARPEGMEAVGLEGDDARVNLAGVRWDWRTDVTPPIKPRGSLHGRALMLTEAKVAEARRLRALGWSYVALGKRYGVTKTTISYAVRGETWAHVPADPQPPDLRGRPRASAITLALMTDGVVSEARVLFAEGWTVQALADRYGVRSSSLGRALQGLSYAHVNAPPEPPPPPPPGPKARPSRAKPRTAPPAAEGSF